MKSRSVYYFFFTFVFFVVLFCAQKQPAFAQLLNVIPDAIDTEISPQYPGPDTNVSIDITNYSTDLNRATITWYLNGRQIQRAIGLTHFEFITGALGTPSSIDITISTVSGKVIRKNITMRPSEVDLVYETGGYTPPFYKGKAKYVNQGFVTVVAVPNMVGANGKKLNSKNLVYKWSVDGEVRGNDSGYGKDSFVFLGKIVPDATKISVEASSLTDGTRATASIELDPERPEVLLYQEDPLYGMLYNKAVIDTFRLDNDEVTFIAVPYFFSGKNSLVSHLDYVWNMNGADLGSVAKKNKVTLKRSGQLDAGRAEVSVNIDNTRDILQRAGYDFSISFDAKSKAISF